MTSGLAKMAVDMLLKEIPQDVRDMLTEENLQRIMTNLQMFLKAQRDGMEYLVTQTNENTATLQTILERLDNDGHNGNGKPARKRLAAPAD